MIIDAWAQHPTAKQFQDPIFDSLRRWTKGGGLFATETQVPVFSTVAAMDQGGIQTSLICAWYAPRNVMISNDEVADFVAQAPSRLVGVGSVDISKPMRAVREIRRCIEQLGFKAIRVLPWLWEAPPTDRRFYPVYVACCEMGVPFCTQIGHTGPLMPSEVGRPIYLDQVAIDFPELVIVGGHIGYPWTDEAIAVATKHENFYRYVGVHGEAVSGRTGRIHARAWPREGSIRQQLPDDHADARARWRRSARPRQ